MKNNGGLRVTVFGLGDVGLNLALGLKLLGGDVLREILLYDISDNQARRLELEYGQIAIYPDLRVRRVSREAMFDCDLFLFCASVYVPPVAGSSAAGSATPAGGSVPGSLVPSAQPVQTPPADVRLAQFFGNDRLVRTVAREAERAGYRGLFGVVSDPVDLLCMSASEVLPPQRVLGFGLGVMEARAAYYSDVLGYGEEGFASTGRAFGPHGRDLLVLLGLTDGSYEISEARREQSRVLTSRVVGANLAVRELGYKPFLAPAISSGALSALDMLRGRLHCSCFYLPNPLGSPEVPYLYWGCRNRRSGDEASPEQIPIGALAREAITQTMKRVAGAWSELSAAREEL